MQPAHYDESCRISAWLCGIAKNVLITYRRKNRQHEEPSEWDSPQPPATARDV